MLYSIYTLWVMWFDNGCKKCITFLLGPKQGLLELLRSSSSLLLLFHEMCHISGAEDVAHFTDIQENSTHYPKPNRKPAILYFCAVLAISTTLQQWSNSDTFGEWGPVYDSCILNWIYIYYLLVLERLLPISQLPPTRYPNSVNLGTGGIVDQFWHTIVIFSTWF